MPILTNALLRTNPTASKQMQCFIPELQLRRPPKNSARPHRTPLSPAYIFLARPPKSFAFFFSFLL